jgi:hypothetical protein
MDDSFSNDEELLAELRAAGRLDPAPEEAVIAVTAAFMWRTIDAELAQLTYDSAFQDDEAALVRHTGTSRFLTFEAPGLTLELEAAVVGEHRRLTGQLVPPQGGVIEIRLRGGATTVEADELGRFSAADLLPGPISLRCRTTSGAVVSTDWVLV